MRLLEPVRYWALHICWFVGDYFELFYVFAGIWIWEASTKTHLSADTKWGLCTGAFIGLAFRNWYKATVRERELKKPVKPAEPERVFVESPSLLLEHLNNPRTLTWMQLVRYMGKWTHVSGRVEEVADSLPKDAVYVTLLRERGQRLNLRFALSERSRLEDLQKGQLVTAACQIQAAFPTVALENCQLIRVDAPALARVS